MAKVPRTLACPRRPIGAADKPPAARAHSLLLGNLSAVPDSAVAVMVHFDLRLGNLLIRGDHLVGLIDFEACRGGHPSMDLFKLWEELRGLQPESLQWVLRGYGGDAGWTRRVEPLMQVYSL